MFGLTATHLTGIDWMSGVGANSVGRHDSGNTLLAQSPHGITPMNSANSQVYQLPPVDSSVRQVVVTAMAVDPRGEFLAVAGDDHIIRILNAQTMQIAHVLGDGVNRSDSGEQRPGHFDWIRTLAFDASGSRLCSAGNDGLLLIWDRRRDFGLMQKIDSAPALACVRFSPSGKQIAAVGFDSQVFLIGSASSQMPKLTCDCVDLRCCRYRDDGSTLAVGGRSGAVHFFNPTTGELQHEQGIHESRIRDFTFMPNSNVLVSVAEDGTVVRYDSEQRQMLAKRRITSGRLFAVVAIDSQTFAAAGSDDEIHLVKLVDEDFGMNVVSTFSGHVGSVATLAMVNGTLVSGGFDATIRRWSLPELSSGPNKIALKKTGVSGVD
ncbi:WD domain, G-beta repeat [Neorhodopirellula pilleata]|uniref:WD domain, G-beta repeat n=2 Tax=Neorhodopirellula pilleata TaxID=2714738 RepID=A0A5C6AWN8_9BACT|nr:WD domain, G-beta repeat [Neorhodopirellula pilleata]